MINKSVSAEQLLERLSKLSKHLDAIDGKDEVPVVNNVKLLWGHDSLDGIQIDYY